jgi:hypothetical protein
VEFTSGGEATSLFDLVYRTMLAMAAHNGQSFRSSPGRRWVVLIVNVLSLLSFAFCFLGTAWFAANRSAYPNQAPKIPIEIIVWICNLPFFICAIVWLSYRVGVRYGAQYLQLEAKHPIMKAGSIYVLALLFLVLFRHCFRSFQHLLIRK